MADRIVSVDSVTKLLPASVISALAPSIDARVAGSPASDATVAAVAAAAASAASAAGSASAAGVSATGAAGAAAGAVAGKVDKGSQVINVLDYGAVGNDSTNNDSFLAAAFAAAVANQRPLYFPPGTYRVTGELDWRSDYLTVLGEPGRSSIKQMTDNTAIMHVGGYRVTVDGMYYRYNAQQTSAHTASAALKISTATQGVFKNLDFYKTYNAILQPRVGWPSTTNTLYSCHFEDIHSNTAAGYHIDISPTNGGNTGSTFSNIYIMNTPVTRQPSGGGIYIGTASELTIRQINIEHGGYPSGITLQSVDNATIDGVHFEGYEPGIYGAGANAGGFFNLSSSSVIIRNVTLYNNIISATAGIASYALFRVYNVCKIDVTGLKESSTTLTGGPIFQRLYVFSTTSLGSTARFRDVTKSVTLGDYMVPGSETSAPIVQQDNRRLGQAVLSNGSDLAVGATTGFTYMPRVAGTPTGVPVTELGGVPFAVDTANNKLWVYNGTAWKSATLA